MGFLYDLAKQYKTVSIVGMAKNAGKTTALNYFIEESMDEGLRLGLPQRAETEKVQTL